MNASEKPYRKITRSALQLANRTTYWLGPDHMMQVSSTGFSESYRRYQFTDIKGFVVTHSSRRLGWAITWGLWCFLFGLFSFASIVRDRDFPPVLVTFTVLGMIPFFWNLALGPTVNVHLVTAVQTVRLRGLSRKRRIDRFMQTVRDAAEPVQLAAITEAHLVPELPSSPPVLPPPLPPSL